MSTFPILKTGAVVQYPAVRRVRFQNQALRFLDGSEQRYRDSAGPLHRWDIQLSQLDAREVAAIEQFFADNSGALGSFTFTDPWDSRAYPDCSLLADRIDVTAAGEWNVMTSLTVVENRGAAC